ncbi:MAG: hypothetical protein ACE5F1_12865, partial [Planctomycetota bacterium]
VEAAGSGLIRLAEGAYTVRLQHVSGGGAQIDNLVFTSQAGTEPGTWGRVKRLYAALDVPPR